MSSISSYLDPNAIEKREYQVNIFENIKEKDSLVVLPTGLGKTIIAVFLICWKLDWIKKALMMAPTRPLCKQHLDFLLDSDSKDEIFYWKSRHEEKKMYDHVYELKKGLENSEDPKSMIRSLKTRPKPSQSDLQDF